MPSIAKALNEEIRRLARKEVRAALSGPQKTNRVLRKSVADLKQRVVQLERQNKALKTRFTRAAAGPKEAGSDDGARVRVTAKGIRSLRAKWGLTREQFAQLLGVTGQAVYQWESKDGPLNLRSGPREAYLAVRSLGSREVRRRLQDAGKKGRGKAKK